MGISRVYVSDALGDSPILPRLPIKANVLVDQTCHARLADFGLLTIISDPANLLSSSSHAHGGTARWMSPERITPEDFGLMTSRPTKSSDCYSLGMVIYETISGNRPFHGDTDLAALAKVVGGERPHRGVGFAEGLWKMVEQCWVPWPDNRPSIEDILQCLEECSDLPPAHSPGMDEGTTTKDPGFDGHTPALDRQGDCDLPEHNTPPNDLFSGLGPDKNHSPSPPTDDLDDLADPPTPLAPPTVGVLPPEDVESLCTVAPLLYATQSVTSGPRLHAITPGILFGGMTQTVPLINSPGGGTSSSPTPPPFPP